MEPLKLAAAFAAIVICSFALISCGKPGTPLGISSAPPSLPLPWTGIRQLGAISKFTYAKKIATDASGNVIVIGVTSGGVSGAGPTGVRDCFMAKYSSSGTLKWVRQFGGVAATCDVNNVATDSSDNIYIVGHADQGLLGNSLIGVRDGYVAKITSSGKLGWFTPIGAPSGTVYTYGIALNSSNNPVITGRTNVVLNGVALSHASTTGDAYIAIVSSANGTISNLAILGAGASTATIGWELAADSSGNIYVTGDATGALPGNTRTSSGSGWDYFLAKYSSDLSLAWVKQLGATGSTITVTYSVAVNKAGTVNIAGFTEGGVYGNSLSGTRDGIIAQYTASGNLNWVKQIGSSATTTSYSFVTLDGSGNAYVVGSSNGALNGNSLNGTNDAIIAKYSSDGSITWLKQLGASGKSTSGPGIHFDSSGDLLICGDTAGSLGGSTLTGNVDSFVTRFDTSGNIQ